MGRMTLVGSYQKFRARILQNTATSEDRIAWDRNQQMNAEKAFGPVIEDFILYSVI